jgi:hypothetical protein
VLRVEVGAHRLFPLFAREVEERFAEQHFRRRAQHLGHPAVGVGGLRLGVDHPDALVRRLDDAAIFQLALAEGFHRSPALAPPFRFAKLAIERRYEPRELALEQEIVRPRLERGDGRLFADRSRHDDEGKIDAAPLQHLECRRSAEARHRVVAENDVPLFFCERLRHLVGRLHLPVRHFVTAPMELAQDEERVVFRVVDDEGADGAVHGAAPRMGTRWFKTSQ